MKKLSQMLCILSFASTLFAHTNEDNSSHLQHIEWSFKGLFSTFKRDELQRGFQVYKEVCSACHGLKRIHFRNLSEIGFSEAEIKSLAASYTIGDGPDTEGKMFERPGLAKDKFPSPFPNDNAARTANNGALPPDLSLIIKARTYGANYLYGLLTGYEKPPAHIHLDAGRHYNKFFPGNLISMAQPLHNNQVTYADGTKATVEQMAKDVTTFLSWAAEPELESRRKLGVKVFLYLLFATGIFYAAMRRVWKDVK